MKQGYILISLIGLSFTLIGNSSVFAEFSFATQSDSSTSTRRAPGDIIQQCLGSTTDFALDSIGDIQLYLSESRQFDIGNAPDVYVSLQSYGGIDACHKGQQLQNFPYANGASTTEDKTLYTFSPTSTILLNPSYYYGFEVSADASFRRPVYWGASTSTSDKWPYGRCVRVVSSSGNDCENTVAPTGYGIRDFYFNIFGETGGTQIIEPNPTWNYVYPPDSTSTTVINWGGAGYIDPADGTDFYVETSLFYAQGIFNPAVDSERESNLDSGSFNLAYSTEVESKLGRWGLTFKIYENIPFFKDELLYATTTYFFLGMDTGTSTDDVIFNDIDEELSKIECEVASITDIGGIIKCVWSVTKAITLAVASAVADMLKQVFDYIVTRAPWGYAYRFYYILTNPDTTGSLEDPKIRLLPQFGSTEFTIPLWSSQEEAFDFLDNATTTGTTTSLTGELNYWLNLFLGLLFGWYVFKRILAPALHHTSVSPHQ